MEMRAVNCAGIPLDQDAIHAGLAGIAEQLDLLLALAAKHGHDLVRRDEGNIGGIGHRARRVLDAGVGHGLAVRRGSALGKSRGRDADQGNRAEKYSGDFMHARPPVILPGG